MATGTVWAQGAGTPRVVDGSAPAPSDATPVVIANATPVRYWHPVLTAALVNTAGGALAVATLQAPPPGQTYVLERIVASNPDGAAGFVMLALGDLGATGATVDLGQGVAANAMVFCDPYPIRVPAGQQLFVLWGRNDPTGCIARLQIRVEG